MYLSLWECSVLWAMKVWKLNCRTRKFTVGYEVNNSNHIHQTVFVATHRNSSSADSRPIGIPSTSWQNVPICAPSAAIHAYVHTCRYIHTSTQGSCRNSSSMAKSWSALSASRCLLSGEWHQAMHQQVLCCYLNLQTTVGSSRIKELRILVFSKTLKNWWFSRKEQSMNWWLGLMAVFLLSFFQKNLRTMFIYQNQDLNFLRTKFSMNPKNCPDNCWVSLFMFLLLNEQAVLCFPKLVPKFRLGFYLAQTTQVHQFQVGYMIWYGSVAKST